MARSKMQLVGLIYDPLSMAESHITMPWAGPGDCSAPRALTSINTAWCSKRAAGGGTQPTSQSFPHHSHACCSTRSPSFPSPACWYMATPCCLTSQFIYGIPQKTRSVTSTHNRELFPTTGLQKDQSRAIIPSGSPKSTFSEQSVFLREATQCSHLTVSCRSTNEVQTRYPRLHENHILTDSELVQTHLKSKERHKPDPQRDHCPLDPSTEQMGTVLWHRGGERRELEREMRTPEQHQLQGSEHKANRASPFQEGSGRGKTGDWQGSHGRCGRSRKGPVK